MNTQAEGRRAPGRDTPRADIPDKFYVIDPSAVVGGGPRHHFMPNKEGEDSEYQFVYGKPTEVPSAHAMRFLKSGFKVALDPDMKQVVKSARGAEEGRNGAGAIELREDEVIASLDELTKEALFKRAGAVPGGDGLKVSATKEELTTIILAHNRNMDAARKRVEIDDVGEDFTVKDLENHRQEFAA